MRSSKSRAVRRWFKPTTPLSNTFPAALRGTGTRTGAGYDPNFKTGYYQHWNLGVERSYVYDLPFGPGGRFASNLSGVAGKIVGGWEISGIYVARSGQPFTPSWSGDIANIGGHERSDKCRRRLAASESDTATVVEPCSVCRSATRNF